LVTAENVKKSSLSPVRVAAMEDLTVKDCTDDVLDFMVVGLAVSWNAQTAFYINLSGKNGFGKLHIFQICINCY